MFEKKATIEEENIKKLSNQLEILKLQKQLDKFKEEKETDTLNIDIDEKLAFLVKSISEVRTEVDNIQRKIAHIPSEITPSLVAEIEKILKGKQKPDRTPADALIPTPISEETFAKITKNVEPKKPHHRRKRVIKGKQIKDAIAQGISESMRTDIVEPRYDTILGYLHDNAHSTIKQIAEKTQFSKWNTEAHLKYGVENKDVYCKKKKHDLKKYWLSPQGMARFVAPIEKPKVAETP